RAGVAKHAAVASRQVGGRIGGRALGRVATGRTDGASPHARRVRVQAEPQFSRWLDALPDGTLVESHRVVPTIHLEPVAGKDAAFDRAVELARAAIGAK